MLENVPGARFPRDPACPAGQLNSPPAHRVITRPQGNEAAQAPPHRPMTLFFLFSRDLLTLGSRLTEKRVRIWIAPVHQQRIRFEAGSPPRAPLSHIIQLRLCLLEAGKRHGVLLMSPNHGPVSRPRLRTRSPALRPDPVSYTHLTLPTNREV